MADDNSLKDKIHQLTYVLQVLEWSGNDDDTECPYCGRDKWHGHIEGCIVGEALKDAEPKPIHLEQPYASLYENPKFFGCCGVQGHHVTTTRDLQEVTCEKCKESDDYKHFMNDKGGKYDLSGQ